MRTDTQAAVRGRRLLTPSVRGTWRRMETGRAQRSGGENADPQLVPWTEGGGGRSRSAPTDLERARRRRLVSDAERRASGDLH